MAGHLQNPFLLQAQAYARAGWAVLPLYEPWQGRCSCGDPACKSAGKHPRTPHGVKDATTDLEIVSKWWTVWPFANIGIATGHASGLFVVDIDGDVGRSEWNDLVSHHQSLPLECAVATGDGQHHYFRLDKLSVGNSARGLGTKIDVRGDGGYVVAAGSRHVSGRKYTSLSLARPRLIGGWGRRSLRPAKPPAWLAERLTSSSLKPSVAVPPAQEKRARERAYAASALEGEMAALRSATEGHRNQQLNRSAFRVGQLVEKGLLDEGEVTLGLTRVAQQIGLSDSEIAKTLFSGLNAGRRKPRAMPTIGQVGRRAPSPMNSDPIDEELAQLDQSDADNARRLVRRYGGKLACSPGRGWLAYDGKQWHADKMLTHFSMAEDTARLIAREADYRSDPAARLAFAKQSLSSSALRRMLEVAKPSLMLDDNKFDSEPYLLNVANGTLDLRTGVLNSHEPKDYLTKIVPIDYDADAPHPVFTEFVKRTFDDDSELIEYVQRAIGLTLTGITTEQVFFLAFGDGQTGKSTLLNLVRDLLGDYGMHTPFETFLSKNSDGGITADLARLDGARLVTAIEVNFNRAFDEAKIKAVTGGEPITARHLYRDFFQFVPQFKLWMAANDLPNARGTADAFWRRVRVIPFQVQVPERERDNDLSAKLKLEYPGILAWAVRGCLAWQRGGLPVPARAREATKTVKAKADHVRKFGLEELISLSGAATRSSHMYDHYTRWCEKRGEKPLNIKRFNAELADRGYGPTERDRDGTRWPGVKLRIE